MFITDCTGIIEEAERHVTVVLWERGDVEKTDGSRRNGENRVGGNYVCLRNNCMFIGIESKLFDESLLGRSD